jgi:hypothetical protein
MEQAFRARQLAPAHTNQILDDREHDPRVARDVAAGEPWVFVEHRTLAEVFASERRR